MTKIYFAEEVARFQSKLKIDFKRNHVILEHQIAANEFDDDTIFLSFNSKETRSLFNYYKTDCVEELMDHIHQHFTTYNSLRRFQDFFENRSIFGTISSSCALTD